MNTTSLVSSFKSVWPIHEWKKYHFFKEDFLSVINPFWLRFPPPSQRSYYVLAVLYSVIMVVGVTGNVLVIFMFIRRRALRTAANLLVMNLAISDFFMLAKMPIFIFNCLYFGPVLGELGCTLYGFLGGLTGTVSIVTLAAIAHDRYNVIVHPLVRKTRRSIYSNILFTWIYGGFFSTLPLLNFGFNRYTPEGYLTSCSFDYLDKELSSRLMIAVFFVAAWVLPFCVITTSYIGICRAVLQARRAGPVDSSRHCKEEERRRTELRLAGVVMSIIALWFVSWTPYAVVALLGVSGYHRLISPLSSMVPALFCKVASCIDPFVYALTHPRFRLELQTLVYQRKIPKEKGPFWGMESQRRESVEEMMVVIQTPSEVRVPMEALEGRCPQTAQGEVKPPSWFRSPFYTTMETKRSTSLRLKSKNLSVSSM